MVTSVLDMWMDTAVILAVVFANTIIGFIQEGKAEASAEALKKMMRRNVQCLETERRRLYQHTNWFPET